MFLESTPDKNKLLYSWIALQ